MLFLQFLYYGFQLLVPCLAKTADKRLFQELIDTDISFLTQSNGILADIPTMIVDTNQAAHFLFTYGI